LSKTLIHYEAPLEGEVSIWGEITKDISGGAKVELINDFKNLE